MTIRDFDALPVGVDERLVVASPLRAGPFRLETVSVGLGDVAIRTGRSTPLLVQGALPGDTAWAVLPLEMSGMLLLNGRSPGPHTAAVYGAGALHESASHGDATWALVGMDAAAVDRLLEVPFGSAMVRAGAHAMLVCDPAAWERAASLLRDAAEVAVTDPAVFEVEEARRSLRSSVLEVCQDLLAGPWDGERPRALRSSLGRQRLVRAMEDYLWADPGRVTTTAAVAATLGMPAPRLQRAFRATFGVSLQRYLRIRRLTLFRQALRSAGPDGPALREIALAHGFWHLNRLAREYRDLFGESLPKDPGRADGLGERATRAAEPAGV